ncbi:hypothetical protein ACFWMS_18645 [Peribacillus butanolivorans]
MGKQLEFVYHPNTKEINEEQFRQVQRKIVEYLVDKAAERVSSS